VTTLAWVIGRGGLLGSHVAATLGPSPSFTEWRPASGTFPWADASRLEGCFAETIDGFLEAADGHRAASIFWCAGSGVVATPAEGMAAETGTWERFLARLGLELERRSRPRPPLSVILASSAGGIYGETRGAPLTETSPTHPLSAYGQAKLLQEKALSRWAEGRHEVSTLVARISNLFGPGQRPDKPQGLISQMSRCLIHQRPVHIYVPLDTVRDFVFVEDAARALVRWTARLEREGAAAGRGIHVLKICASERPTTIAGLVGDFRRLGKRQLRVVSGLHPLAAQHAQRLHFRSTVWADEPRPDATSLLVGVHRVYQHQLALAQRGELPLPAPLRVPRG
jgi:UDP-glucose 4-epimerase